MDLTIGKTKIKTHIPKSMVEGGPAPRSQPFMLQDYDQCSAVGITKGWAPIAFLP